MVKRWFLSYSSEGIGLSGLMLVITLFVVTGLKGNVKEATIAETIYSVGTLFGALLAGTILDKKAKYNELIMTGFILAGLTSAISPFLENILIYCLFVFVIGLSISVINPSITLFLSRHLPNTESLLKKS